MMGESDHTIRMDLSPGFNDAADAVSRRIRSLQRRGIGFRQTDQQPARGLWIVEEVVECGAAFDHAGRKLAIVR